MIVLLARAGEDEPPLAEGVTVEVRSERTEFAIGDPILVDVVFRNEGEKTWELWEPLVLRFYDPFDVRDADGAKVPNPFAAIERCTYDGPVRSYKLPPGGTVTLKKYVNESAAFDKPGEYVVTFRTGVSDADGGASSEFRCPSKPLKIRILPAPRKERDTVIADLKALSRDPWGKLRAREEYARYRPYVTKMSGETDALRLLAFLREQDLLPFWTERLTDSDRSAFAPEALAGLPDRAAVLKALEERLERGERVLWLYAYLAVPKTDDLDWKEVDARRDEIRKRYEKR